MREEGREEGGKYKAKRNCGREEESDYKSLAEVTSKGSWTPPPLRHYVTSGDGGHTMLTLFPTWGALVVKKELEAERMKFFLCAKFAIVFPKCAIHQPPP